MTRIEPECRGIRATEAMRRRAWWLLACLVAWPGALRADERPQPKKVAVLRLKALGLDERVTAALDEALPRRIEESRCCQVLAFADLERILQFQQLKQTVTCEEDSCAAEIAGALGVDYVVMGSVSRLGKKLTVSLAAVDSRSAKSAVRSAETLEGEDTVLLDAVARAGRIIGNGLLPPTPAWPAWTLGAGGVALLGAAGTALAWANFTGRPEFRQTELQAANNLALATNVLLGVGGALVLGGGIGWVVTQPPLPVERR